MRKKRLALIATAVAVLTLAMVVAVLPWPKPPALAVGVGRYQRQADRILATVTLTNSGHAPIAVALNYDVQVRTPTGSTNYAVNTRHTIFLHGGREVLLSHSVYALPLPADALDGQMTLRFRRQTPRERLVWTLRWMGIKDWRLASKLLGPPLAEERFVWHTSTSDRFKVPADLGDRSAP